MFGYFRGASSLHKRVKAAKDFIRFRDIENNPQVLRSSLEQDISNPPWKLSFPHVLVATLVPFLFGYQLGVVNEPLETISIDLDFHGNTLKEGLVVSICLVGAFLGSLISGWIADGVGRRKAFQLCALPMLIGASICATTENLEGMLLGRFLVGTGLGVGPSVASLYVTEVSPAHVRGTYGSFIQIASCLGFTGAILIGSPVRSTIGWWRICFWISTIPASMLIFLMMFCAESPHWLYKQGRIDEAEAELEKLLGGLHVKAAMIELSKTQTADEIGTVKLVELLHGRHSRVVFIGSSLFALQQLSGINAIFYFSSTVFRRAGVPSNLANVFVGIANFIGSFVASALMDKLGRKGLLFWSFFGMTAPFVLKSAAGNVALSFTKGAVSMVLQVLATASFASSPSALYLSIGGMLLFVLTFSAGAGPVPPLLLPEIFPSRIRAKAMAFCMSVHWIFNFLVGLSFLPLLDKLGPSLLYSVFTTFCLLAVVYVKRNVLETKGKSLQEIEIALLPQDQH